MEMWLDDFGCFWLRCCAVEEYLKSKGKKIVQVTYNPQTSSTQIKQNVIAQA